MASRAWASAEAVTVQVLTTTMSAADAVEAEVQPRSSNWRSRAAPSACVARQPNCSMKKLGIKHHRSEPKNTLHRVRGVHRERREKNLSAVLCANPYRDVVRRSGRVYKDSGFGGGRKNDSNQ